VPLYEYQIAAQTSREPILVSHDIISRAVTNKPTLKVSARNVGSLGIQRIDISTIKLVRKEGKRIGVKAFLGRNFTMRDGTCLEGKMSHVVSRKYTLEGNVGSWFVAALSDCRHESTNAVGGQVIIVIAHKSAASFRSSNVETMRTSFHCWIRFSPSGPLPFDACVVVA
jgi:hypothetical protein